MPVGWIPPEIWKKSISFAWSIDMTFPVGAAVESQGQLLVYHIQFCSVDCTEPLVTSGFLQKEDSGTGRQEVIRSQSYNCQSIYMSPLLQPPPTSETSEQMWMSPASVAVALVFSSLPLSFICSSTSPRIPVLLSLRPRQALHFPSSLSLSSGQNDAPVALGPTRPALKTFSEGLGEIVRQLELEKLRADLPKTQENNGWAWWSTCTSNLGVQEWISRTS